jgi:hypothetical protein
MCKRDGNAVSGNSPYFFAERSSFLREQVPDTEFEKRSKMMLDILSFWK